MTSNQDLIDEIRNYIVRRVNEEYEKNRQPMLLSNLGLEIYELKSKVKFDNLFPGLKLSQFIQIHLSGVVEIAQHVRIPLRVGAWPANRQELPNEYRTSDQPLADRFLRYDRRFWSAFGFPIDLEKRRYIPTFLPFIFTDIDEGAAAPKDHVEIPVKWIVSGDLPPGPSRSELIRSHINAWLEHTGLSAATFSESPARQVQQPPHWDTERSLPRAFIASLLALSPQEKSRILLPLDIVESILQKLEKS